MSDEVTVLKVVEGITPEQGALVDSAAAVTAGQVLVAKSATAVEGAGANVTKANLQALTGGGNTTLHGHSPETVGSDPAGSADAAAEAAAEALARHAELTTEAHGGGVLSTAQKTKVEIVARMEFECANSFDPSVSGFSDPVTGAVPPIGSRMTSVDGTKHWNKWGAGATQWAAEHEITATLDGPRSRINVSDFTGSLACDTLGGFAWSVWGTATTTAPNIWFAFSPSQTGSVSDGNRQSGIYNWASMTTWYENSAILSGFTSGAFRITVEARAFAVLSTAGCPLTVNISAMASNGGSMSEVLVRGPISATEITNPGLVITGGTFDAGCKVSLRR